MRCRPFWRPLQNSFRRPSTTAPKDLVASPAHSRSAHSCCTPETSTLDTSRNSFSSGLSIAISLASLICAQLLCRHSRQSIHTPSVLLQPVNLQAFRSSFAAPGWQIPTLLLELEKRHAVAAGVTDSIDLDDDDRARSFIDWKMSLQTRELCLVHFDGPSLSMQS